MGAVSAVTMPGKRPPLVIDTLAALEAREYDRALVLLEEAAADQPDDKELAVMLAAVQLKLECERLLKVYET